MVWISSAKRVKNKAFDGSVGLCYNVRKCPGGLCAIIRVTNGSWARAINRGYSRSS